MNELVKIVFPCVKSPSSNIRRSNLCTRYEARLGKYFKKTRKNTLFNKNIRCHQNVNMPSTVQSSSVDLRTCLSSSDGTIEEDRCKPTAGTANNSGTSQRDQIKSSPFLPESLDQLCKYTSKQMSQNQLLKSSNAGKAFTQMTNHVSQTTSRASNAQSRHIRNTSNQQDEKTDKSINGTTAIDVRKTANKTPPMCSRKRKRI